MKPEIVQAAAKEKLTRLSVPAAGAALGLGLALLFTQAAEAAPGGSLDPKYLEWVPAAILELLAFGGGAVQSWGLTHSRWYERELAERNARLRSQLEERVAPQVVQRSQQLEQTGKLELRQDKDGKPEPKEDFIRRAIKENVENQFKLIEIQPVNHYFHALQEGLRMAAGFGGPGLMICDAIIGLGWARLGVDLVYGVGGITWMVGIDPKERLMSDTLE